MVQVNKDLKSIRKQEIIDACKTLYEKMSFKEITIKEIGKVTSFTRTSIYNYFQTKEEIFLALLQQEYEILCSDMEQIYNKYDKLSVEDFAKEMALIFDKRQILLKIVSMNHYDMESCSRIENIIEFKVVFGRTIKSMAECLKKFFPQSSQTKIDNFTYAFFPFLFGVYPYTAVTEKQKQAILLADINYNYYTSYQLIYNCIKQMLSNFKSNYEN